MAILQSNYVPWKGYFDLIGAVDHFVFFDDAQFTKNDWRNRNRIKTPQGVQWLSVPVHGSVHKRIRDVAICDAACGTAHWKRLVACYARAPHFDSVARWLQPLYCDADWHQLSSVNRRLVGAICAALGIGTRLGDSADYLPAGDLSSDELPPGPRNAPDRSQRLIAMCLQAGASTYVSGPAARAYLDVDAFTSAGLQVEWFDYSGYPPYPQLWGGPFVHEVSVLDLLFNCGPESARFLRKQLPA